MFGQPHILPYVPWDILGVDPGVYQYNYLFIYPVVISRLTVVYSAYLSVSTCILVLHLYLIESTSSHLMTVSKQS